MTKAPLTLIANVQLGQKDRDKRSSLYSRGFNCYIKKGFVPYTPSVCAIKLFTVVISTAAFLAKYFFNYRHFPH